MHPLPLTIRKTPLTDGVQFDLPIRPLGWLRLFAVIPIVIVGIVTANFVLPMYLGLIQPAVTGNAMGWLPLAFISIFALAFLAFAFKGAAIMFGGSRIAIRNNQIYVKTTALGPFGKTQRMPTQEVTGIEVHSTHNLTGGRFDFAALSATCKPGTKTRYNRKGLLLAWGYPHATLAALGEAITQEIDTNPHRSSDRAEDTDRAPIDVKVIAPNTSQLRTTGIKQDEAEEDRVQPVDSTALVDDRADGLTLTLPPIGIAKGSKGLFGFAVIWTGIISLVTLPALFTGGLSPAKTGGIPQTLGICAFLSVFWGIGLTLLLVSINASRRKAIIDVVGRGQDATLLITRQGIFGSKQQDWAAHDLQSVKVAPSGTKVNDRDIYNLHITPKDDKPTKLFSERDDDELHWLATTLMKRLALDMPSRLAREEHLVDPADQPANSSVILDRHGRGLTLALPRMGIWQASKGLLAFAIVWNLFIAGFITLWITLEGLNWSLIFPMFIMSIFVAVGIGLILGAVNAGIRIGLIDVAGHGEERRLTVTTKGLFGKMATTWLASDLKTVRVGPSGTTINDTEVLNLQVVPVTGEDHGYFAERSDQDLHWIAAVLRQELALNAVPATVETPGEDKEPE